MAKRLTDSEKWKKSFIKKLSVEAKLFWVYLLDSCNHAGIWDVDIDLANFLLGTQLTEEKIVEEIKEKIVIFDDGKKWFIPSFIEFQQPSGLNDKNNAHRSIISILKKYNLLSYLTEPLSSPSAAPEEPLGRGPCNSNSNCNSNCNSNLDDGGLHYTDNHEGFSDFVELFPTNKRNFGPTAIDIWETMSSRDKDMCLQLTPYYIQKFESNDEAKYIKPVGKFLEEGFYRQLHENQSRYLGKKVNFIERKKSENIDDLMKKLFD